MHQWRIKGKDRKRGCKDADAALSLEATFHSSNQHAVAPPE